MRRLPLPSPRLLIVRWLLSGLTGLVAVLVTATTAQAYSYTITDGFDPDNSTWTTDGAGNHGWWWAAPIGGPVSGWNYARVSMTGPGFSSIVRKVHIPYYAKTCQAHIYLRNNSANLAPVPGNIEVIRPSDWTYLSRGPVFVATGSSWTYFGAPSWTNTVSDVVFRVSVIGVNDPNVERILDVDDLSVTCSY